MSQTDNLAEYSVSELAHALKRTVEERFDYVRVRGEISRWMVAGSGHAYLRLKDETAVLDGVMWKGTLGRLRFRPEDGLEVIASGRITTYPGKSTYQIVIDQMEPAGAGALMALLEARKQKLAAEGLFAQGRKQALPWLPEVIGVVTSPTGAVIRDILHRLADRFPRRVLLWPVLVQGDGAAAQIAAAVQGFNALKAGGPIPQPDVLIVARGGGSLEDLWAFNEEIVVRAVAASRIPVISAVGHETDTTLIDFAADVRAPTPTAAAEMAVPVRSELLTGVGELALRLTRAVRRGQRERSEAVKALARALPRPQALLGLKQQRFDELALRLKRGLGFCAAAWRSRLDRGAARLTPLGLKRRVRLENEALDRAALALDRGQQRLVAQQRQRLGEAVRLLESLSHQRVLDRGFALVRDSAGMLVRGREAAAREPGLELEFADGRLAVQPAGKSRPAKSASPAAEQGQLL